MHRSASTNKASRWHLFTAEATSADSDQATTSGELSATDWRRSHHLPQTTISGFIEIGQSQNLQTVYSKSSPSGCIYRLGKGHDRRRDSLPFSSRERAASDRP